MDEEIFEKRFLLCFQKVAFSSSTGGREVKAEKKMRFQMDGASEIVKVKCHLERPSS